MTYTLDAANARFPAALITSGEGVRANIVVVINGQPLQADDAHPNFTKILAAVNPGGEGDEEFVANLFDQTKAVTDKFERISERTTVRHGRVFFDGDPVPDVLERQVIRFLDDGVDDWKCLVKFWELLATNPEQHSREQALKWLNAHDFSIVQGGEYEGYIMGYKGVNADRGSSFSGYAIVDGEEVNGHVPNKDGSVIEMPRSRVTHDPRQTCSSGLHVGTPGYAHGFGSQTILVYVHPRDIVSVPSDCGGAKMRVCRYRVVKGVERGWVNESAVYTEPVYDEAEYDEDDYCSDCGELIDECVCDDCPDCGYGIEDCGCGESCADCGGPLDPNYQCYVCD